MKCRTLIAGVLAVLGLSGCASAWCQAPAAGAGQQSMQSVVENEAAGWLQGLLRIDTTNPPGNELVAAKYLGDILKKEGIPYDIYESTPGRGVLIARLNAGALPDPAHALLLMAHLDVVGVQKDKWSVDPFGGIIKDGYIYGRGAIDDKGMVATCMATMVQLKRSGARLTRDVIFLAEGDEEAGGDAGMNFAVAKHWDKIAAAYALNEGGRAVLKDGKVQYVGIQASEKVPYNVDVVATGTSGHASVPLKDNPVVHLAAAIEKIGSYQAPVELNSVTREYFWQLANIEPDDLAKWMRVLDTADRGAHAAQLLSDADPAWNSMLRDSISPTMLRAGVRANVIPSDARATLNIRLLPEHQLAPLLEKLRQAVNDPAVKFEPQESIGQSAPSSPVDGEFYNFIVSTAKAQFPGAVVMPMMGTGGTDSAILRLRNVQAYGLLPFPMEEADIRRMHGNDERVPLDEFRKGVEFMYAITAGFAARN